MSSNRKKRKILVKNIRRVEKKEKGGNEGIKKARSGLNMKWKMGRERPYFILG